MPGRNPPPCCHLRRTLSIQDAPCCHSYHYQYIYLENDATRNLTPILIPSCHSLQSAQSSQSVQCASKTSSPATPQLLSSVATSSITTVCPDGISKGRAVARPVVQCVARSSSAKTAVWPWLSLGRPPGRKWPEMRFCRWSLRFMMISFGRRICIVGLVVGGFVLFDR
ncbi:hypothetical protein EDC01DRAFT_464609 [Geopyxis carbonaria]|nr:hypothetical protein EDC01DRAFT_464609 [Geopyxis carbonaria]